MLVSPKKKRIRILFNFSLLRSFKKAKFGGGVSKVCFEHCKTGE